jgi:predicted esterase
MVGLVAILILFSASAKASPLASGTYEENEYLIYVPDGIDSELKYPLIVAFSPGADADGLIKTWEQHAQQNHCLILASKIIRNGMDIPNHLIELRQLIKEKVAQQFPVKDGVIALGTSGGGMAAHLFSFFHPDTVAAVISSVGYIHENSLKHKDTYPQNKVCAFLTSPTDFNYKLMKEDRKFLASLGWQLKWYEFSGGHRTAPADVREEALQWVLEALATQGH